MAKDSKIGNPNIKTIFVNMNYEEIMEDAKEVKDWLMKRNNIIYPYGDDKPTEFKTNISNVNSGEQLATVYLMDNNVKQKLTESLDKRSVWNNITNFERIKLIKKFVSEIEQNGNLICKIESCTRGLLMKDTKKFGVTLLLEYLQYFSNWSFATTTECSDPTVIYAADNTCLGILGSALGPALARGSIAVLHLGPALSVCAAFLIELSIKAGFPKGAIQLVPSNSDLWVSETPAMIYLFGNLCSEHFQKPALYEKKQVVAMSSNKTPMIIFSNSDLDSACECIISAVWEYEGMLPWATDTILVQEDIYPEFVEKIKQRIKKLRIGDGTDKQADISSPHLAEINKLNEMIKDARAQGIDVYQSKSESSKFQPTLFIGAKVYSNNVMTEDKNVCAAATILAFRTPKEAIALANNNKQGFAASLWSENISLINEVTKQLNVGTVWVNSHGIIKASVPFTTYKLDGVGYIGGSLGFYEYEDQCRKTTAEKIIKSVPKAISVAQKAQGIWSKLSLESRIEKLSKWAMDLENHTLELTAVPDINEITVKMHECIIKYSSINTSRTIENFELTVKREALGIVVLAVEGSINIPVILGALFLGNAVLLISKDSKKYEFISKNLPPGLLMTMDFQSEVTHGIQINPRIMFAGGSIKSENFQKSYNSLNEWDSILRRCTLSKCIWTTVGDSL